MSIQKNKPTGGTNSSTGTITKDKKEAKERPKTQTKVYKTQYTVCYTENSSLDKFQISVDDTSYKDLIRLNTKDVTFNFKGVTVFS